MSLDSNSLELVYKILVLITHENSARSGESVRLHSFTRGFDARQ